MDKCLHCAISETINDWFDQYGKRADSGRVILDIVQAISSTAEVMGDLTESAGERSQRKRALRLAHAAIDAKVQSLRTGKIVPVDIPVEH